MNATPDELLPLVMLAQTTRYHDARRVLRIFMDDLEMEAISEDN